MFVSKAWAWLALASATLVSGVSHAKDQARREATSDTKLGTFLHNRISPNY